MQTTLSETNLPTANIHCVSTTTLLLLAIIGLIRPSYSRTPNFFPEDRKKKKRSTRRGRRRHKPITEGQTILTQLITEIENQNEPQNEEEEPNQDTEDGPLHPILEDAATRFERINPLIPKAKARNMVKDKLEQSTEILNLFNQIEDASSKQNPEKRKRPKLTCPMCNQSEHVGRNGRATDGQQKWICNNHHDSGVKRKSAGPVYFRDYSSMEGLQCTELLLKDVARHLLLSSASYSEISELLKVSRYLVEFTASMISTNVRRFISKIVPSMKKIALFSFDCGGTGFRASFGLAMGNVEDQPIAFPWKGSEPDAFRKFIRLLKEEGLYQNNRKNQYSIFLVDGLEGFLEVWAEEVPEAILVRQFHSDRARGLVMCHWFYKGKEYSCQVPWHLLLHEGKASEKAQKKRKLRRSWDRKPRACRTIPKEVRIWENRRTKVYISRPRKSRDTSVDTMESDDRSTTKTKGGQDENGDPTNRCTKGPLKAGPPAKLIFSGPPVEAMKLAPFKFLYHKLKARFAGIYITTNMVEGEISEFKRLNAKSRSPNSGETLFNVQRAFFYIRKQGLTREEVEATLDDIFTVEAINGHMIIRGKRSGAGGTRRGGIIEALVSALQNDDAIEICYTDTDGINMNRIVEPLDIKESNGHLYLDAFCRLRQEHRRFNIVRIESVIPTQLLSEFRLCKYSRGLLEDYEKAANKHRFCEDRGLERSKVQDALQRHHEKEELMASLMKVEVKRTKKGRVRWTDTLIEAVIKVPDLKAFCEMKRISLRYARKKRKIRAKSDS
jgi:transposase-like protein